MGSQTLSGGLCRACCANRVRPAGAGLAVGPGPGDSGIVRGAGSAPRVSAEGVPYLDPISPSTAASVSAELEHRARHLGDQEVIGTYADLEALYPAAGGVHTITEPTRLTAFVSLPSGVRIVQTSAGSVIGDLAVRCGFSGDADGPLMSGVDVALLGVTLSNASGDESASHVQSTGASETILSRVIFAGAAPVGVLQNFATARIEGCAVKGCAAGLRIAGTWGGVTASGCVAQDMPAEACLFELPASSAPTIGISILGCSLIASAADQHLLKIDSSASLPAGRITVRLQQNAVPIPNPLAASGTLLDPTGITETDGRVWASQNLNGLESLILGHEAFLDIDNPITVTYAGSGQFATIPNNNGSGGVLELISTSQRFTLVLDDPASGDWYLRYDGPLPQVTAEVFAEVSLQGAGGQSAEIVIQSEIYRAADQSPAFAAIPGSIGAQVQQRAEPDSRSGGATAILSPGDRFRIRLANMSNTSATEVVGLNLRVIGKV